ncbi:hypothetical protein [Adhaeribacter pallidiroseus]|uniref:Uncharacterized protein n=1 Tax=Adhaeribacter pallidiroseus TaxID=2072847 RepID=A0A369Q9S8_9BACT|nr:hypothetical protein [Adhaeribacter pallidiroseus]RDC61454.1 hypothetical protein AHMF7616_00033 [Adhaeribacter pallidiroseus]
MDAVKKFVNVVVMLYLIAATLIYLDVLKVGQDTNPNFNTTFYIIGGVILLLELLVENLYIATLKREHTHKDRKVNELKALLYDQKHEMQQYKNSAASNVSPGTTPLNSSASSYDRNTIIVKPGFSSGQDSNRPSSPNSDSI